MKRIAWVVLWLFVFSGGLTNAWSRDIGLAPKPPKISTSPSSVNFRDLNLGSTSKQAVTINNTGGSDLIINSITLSGSDASHFSQTNNCTTVAAGKSCNADVTFGPTSGGKKSAIMSITSNDPKKPTVSVKLSGNVKSPPCVYSLSSSGQECGASGGTWSVNVNASSGCAWTAATRESWITISSGASGSGQGAVTYAVAPNASTNGRTGKMTIAKQTFTVTQSGATCACSISPSSRSLGPSGETGSISVTTAAGCKWTAASNAGWITITSKASGTGNGTVSYAVASNISTSPRTGTLTIGDQTFTATQSGANSPPLATLSKYQEDLLDSYGNPDYISIRFIADPQRREETWVYADLQRMYLFWDGQSLGQTGITVDPKAYSKPPLVDPSVFTRDSKLPDLVKLLESNYTEVDQSVLKNVIGSADFKTYQFREAGLYVALLDGNLVAVQTIDIPRGAAQLSEAESSSGENDSRERKTQASPKLSCESQWAILYMALIIYGMGGIDIEDDPSWRSFVDGGCWVCKESETPLGEKCIDLLIQVLRNSAIALEHSPQGMASTGQQIEGMNTAENKCSSTRGKTEGAVGTDDTFPYCKAKECTGYEYGPWSDCGSNGKQTRQVTARTPSGCAIDPPFPPVVSQSCTAPVTTYSGPFEIQGPVHGPVTVSNTVYTCNCTLTVSGKVTIEIAAAPDNTYSGTVDLVASGTQTSCSLTPTPKEYTSVCKDNSAPFPLGGKTAVSGTLPNLTWTISNYTCVFETTLSGKIGETSFNGTIGTERLPVGGCTMEGGPSDTITLPRLQ